MLASPRRHRKVAKRFTCGPMYQIVSENEVSVLSSTSSGYDPERPRKRGTRSLYSLEMKHQLAAFEVNISLQ